MGALEKEVICNKSGTRDEWENRITGGYTCAYADCQLEEVRPERYPEVRNQSTVGALSCPLKQREEKYILLFFKIFLKFLLTNVQRDSCVDFKQLTPELAEVIIVMDCAQGFP